MDNTLLQQLAKRLNLTNSEPEPEPYLLSSDDEIALVKNAIEADKNWHIWKMRNLKMQEGDIEAKIALINFEERVDKEKLFQQANSSKNQELWQKENRRKEKEALEQKKAELQKLWSATRMFRYMEWASANHYQKPLIVNDDNKHLITALCYFLSNDARFETELKYSRKKGLLIRGVAGIGKTHLVKCLSFNDLKPIQVLSMIEITDDIKAQGEYQLNIDKSPIIYLDDVGTEEPVVNHYGTKITFFKNFIEMHYLRELDPSRLIVSTNNSFSEIQEKYGFRVRSRMKDMFNVIDVAGQDMRG